MKKVFLEILQNAQENTCARVPFLNKNTFFDRTFLVAASAKTDKITKSFHILKGVFVLPRKIRIKRLLYKLSHFYKVRFNPLQPSVAFLYPLKTSENLKPKP